MNRTVVASLWILSLFILGASMPPVSSASSTWSSEVASKTYHWRAEKSELRDIESVEHYPFSLLGGMNVPGGDNSIRLKSGPPDDFDILSGDRLDLSWVVEGDMVIPLSDECDIHLALLPLSMNGTDFFELLFSEQKTLENLTWSVFVNSSIEAGKASATLKYNDLLDVVYEWDTSTGILSRKEVTAPSGLQLVVVRGSGTGFYAPATPPILIIGLMTLVILTIVFASARRLAKRRSAVQ